MELFTPLSDFYKAVTADARIGTAHISLYMALLHRWNLSGGKNPIIINRNDIMNAAKISSRHTYNRCMSNLNEFGYIIYEPAMNRTIKSKVSLKFCEK